MKHEKIKEQARNKGEQEFKHATAHRTLALYLLSFLSLQLLSHFLKIYIYACFCFVVVVVIRKN
jgi:hypothetical protein